VRRFLFLTDITVAKSERPKGALLRKGLTWGNEESKDQEP
jgi:hypothetical protein